METEKGLNMDSIEIELDTLKITGDPTKLYEALARAQIEFSPVPKKNQGQTGGKVFHYAGYATLVRCVRPALTRHGIAFLQPLHTRGESAVTTTILAGHGASIQTSFEFRGEYTKKQKDGTVVHDPQEFGRCHTYYRRYQLQAMLGIEGDGDADDLPDVNEEKAQFAERSEPKNEAPKEPAEAKFSPTKRSMTPLSELPQEPSGSSSTPAKSDTKPSVAPVEDIRTINVKLEGALKELKWPMAKMREFYAANVDPAGFDKASNLTIEQKTALFGKLVEVAGVVPF